MKKRIIALTFVAVLAVALFAGDASYTLPAKDVELSFENITIRSIDFDTDSRMTVMAKGEVDVRIEGSNVYVSAAENEKIKLILPADVNYRYIKEGLTCEFTSSSALCITEDNEIIEFADGQMVVRTTEGELVKIGKEGLLINDGGDRVEISSDGIIVEAEDENKQITGFWGKLLGGVVNSLVKVSVGKIADDSGEVMKSIINESGFGFHIKQDSNDERFNEIVSLTYKDPAAETLILNVDNQNGSVVILDWDDDFIDITATKQCSGDEADLEDIKVQLTGKHGCNIQTTIPQHVQGGVSYLIKVPRRAHLQTIETTNGNISIRNTRGEVVARTSNGMIDIRHLKGSLDAATSNGALEVQDVDTILGLSTSNGRIIADIQTLDQDLTVTTSNAMIKLNVSPKIHADILAATSNAGIEIEDLSVMSDTINKNHLRGKMNGGGRILKVSTSNGTIRLHNAQKEM